MDQTHQIKVKVSCLLQQFVQGQTEPSMESLWLYQINRWQFRKGLLLLKMDANGQKWQREAQVLTDASDKEVAKDKVGVFEKENAKSPKAGIGLAEEIVSDQCMEAAEKILASE